MSNTDPSADEWTVDVLELDAYLDRVRVSRPLRPDVETLARLHRAHVAAIPFENLDVILGRGVSVDLDRVQAKLVHDRRGGYCYEHGVLFAAVLTRLGFTVHRQLARMDGDPARPNPRTHMAVLVDIADRRWLADTGFGSGLLEPVPLHVDAPVRQGEWTYRLIRPAPGLWLLQLREGDHWAGQYTVDEQPQHRADVVVSNHFTSTWPTSPFVQRAVVVRKDEHEVRRLLGRELSSARPGTPPVTQTLTDAQFVAALRDLGLELVTADVEALLAHVPD